MYKKIDLTYKTEHKGYIYLCSTNQAATCKQAKENYIKHFSLLHFSYKAGRFERFNPKNLRANFDRTK